MKKTIQIKTVLLIFVYLWLITFSSELNQMLHNSSLENSDLTFPIISLADTGVDQNTTPIRSLRIITPSPSIIKDFFDSYIADCLKSTIFLNYATQNHFHFPFTSFKFVINEYTADS